MYIPTANQIHDIPTLHDFIRRFPFAPVVTAGDGAPFASHLPFLLDTDQGEFGTLRAHVARANPQWREFAAEKEAVVIFQGPHAYVSPLWYAAQPAVPTWNYVAVHAYGVPRVVGDDALRTLLRDMVAAFEAPGSPLAIPEEHVEKLARAVVGFEIEITRLEGKFKLSQNRSEQDRLGVIRALADSSSAGDRETGEWMQAYGLRPTETA